MRLLHTNNCKVFIFTINVLDRACAYFSITFRFHFDNGSYFCCLREVITGNFLYARHEYVSLSRTRRESTDHVYSSYARSQDRTRAATKVASGQCRIPNERSARLDDDEAVCHT